MLYATRSQLDPEWLSRALPEASSPAVEPQTGAAAPQAAGVDSDPWHTAALRFKALAARLPALPAPTDVEAAELLVETVLKLEAAAADERETLRADLLANDSLGG